MIKVTIYNKSTDYDFKTESGAIVKLKACNNSTICLTKKDLAIIRKLPFLVIYTVNPDKEEII